RFDFLAGWDRRLNENLFLPNDWCGRTFPGNFDSPFDVLCFVPRDWRISVRGRPVLPRPAPLRPVILGGCPGERYGGAESERCGKKKANSFHYVFAGSV